MALACTAAPAPAEPTPDIEATVEARLARLEATTAKGFASSTRPRAAAYSKS